MPFYKLTFHLKEHYLNCRKRSLYSVRYTVLIHSENNKRSEADTISVFQDFNIAVLQIISDNIADTGVITAYRTHPKNIMIAPFNIHRMILHKQIHYPVGLSASVKYISHQMQMVYRKSLYKCRKCNDKLVSIFQIYDCL